jgi:hypothetical protein
LVCIPDLITIDKSAKGEYSICILQIYYTRQNRLFIKYVNNKRCLSLVERVLLGGKIMVQDYMFTIYSYTLHQLYIKSCKSKLQIYNNRTKCQYNYTCSIKTHINTIHIFVLINILCTFRYMLNNSVPCFMNFKARGAAERFKVHKTWKTSVWPI